MLQPSPDNITALGPNDAFVFGSNRAGRHGKAAALFARRTFGAVYGVGEGPTGRCYALPTKDRDEALTILPLNEIGLHVQRFLVHAAAHPETRYLVTQIGCGKAGYTPADIAPLFFAHEIPANVLLPAAFIALK